MRGRILGAICALVLALPLAAQDLGAKPKPRPAAAAVQAQPEKTVTKPAPRPALQNAAAADAPKLAAPRADVQANTPTMARSPRPAPRPAALEQAFAQLASAAPAAAAAPTSASNGAAAPKDPNKPNLLQLLFGAKGAQKQPKDAAQNKGEDLASATPPPAAAPADAPRKGSVCGDRSIRGEAIAPIKSKVKGCGVADPVRVTEVAGVRLTEPVTVECGTVRALKDWIDSAVRPAFGNRELVKMRIAAHYVCRSRNNKRGARISEHGKGKALDISGFIFADGSEWTILRDYNKQVRRAHKGACGIFGTTLGPGSDGYHEDHLHFDIAAHRSGPYCR